MRDLKRMRLLMVLWLGLSAAAGSGLADESGTPAAAPSGQDPVINESDSVQAVDVTASAPGNVTVDFKDADIQNVLRILAFKSGVNIVAGKDVTGAVTIRLVDVPWEKALDTILKTNGYGYDRQDNIIRVVSMDNLNREELNTEVFVLNYAKASEIEKSVSEMLTERGKVRADGRSNTLIVTDSPASLQNIREIVQRLDAPTAQVLIEAKVIELSDEAANRLGIKWNVSATAIGPNRPTTFPWPATQRTALSRFFPVGRGTQTGAVESAGGTTTTTSQEDFPKGKGGAGSDAIQPTFPVADKDEFSFGTLDMREFQVALEAIKNDHETRILSEPHIVVLNNQEAKVLVGEIIGLPTFERSPTTGRMEITGYKDRDLGVRLAVVPQINSEKEIVVTIHPEITTLLGYDKLTDDISAPRFSTREAMTNVRIKSGQTIAIGGLVKEETSDEVRKVPILGEIPLLDKFFTHQAKIVKKTDLLFFMTVTVLKDAVPTSHKL
jgi:type IV pilus assembly protein PilQ